MVHTQKRPKSSLASCQVVDELEGNESKRDLLSCSFQKIGMDFVKVVNAFQRSVLWNKHTDFALTIP